MPSELEKGRGGLSSSPMMKLVPELFCKKASVKVPVSKAGRKGQAAGSCGRQTAVQVQSPGSQPNVAGPGHAGSEGPAAPTPQDPRPASEDTGTVLEPGDACVFEYKR
ncbi:unnamed protein product [Rangifer tarandus platyrhynchus]|uniref:Uncharacterized protein n=1 Tax=Rangifer tarandus platyrhynchus TaxID=3082113 RepID=A0AC59Z3K9_RANTA